MSNKLSATNALCNCHECGRLTHSSIENNLDIQLCRLCYDDANMENDHNDGRHETPKDGCRYCRNESPEFKAQFCSYCDTHKGFDGVCHNLKCLVNQPEKL